MSVNPVMILEFGSYTTRIGKTNSYYPTTFPSVIGLPKKDLKVQKTTFGKQVNHILYNKVQPVEYGIPKSTDDMIPLYEYSIKELNVNCKETGVVYIEGYETRINQRKNITDIFFQQFDIPSFYMAPQTTLALYGSGRTIGVVVDIGDTITHVSPHNEGLPIQFSHKSQFFGGRDITENIIKYLQYDKNLSFKSVAMYNIANEIKEKHCSLKDQDYDKIYELPDGTLITLTKEILKCPQELFQPSVMFLQNEHGIPDLLTQSYQMTDKSLRKDLFKNIILSGGSTSFEGFQTKLYNEMDQNRFSICNTIYDPSTISWEGGMIIATMSNFFGFSISKQEYEENGPDIVNRKCVYSCQDPTHQQSKISKKNEEEKKREEQERREEMKRKEENQKVEEERKKEELRKKQEEENKQKR